jgi:predicted  nucleic acid-binding Zn-ribbon protein
MFANRHPYQTNDVEVEIIEHPNSVELLVRAESGHEKAMALIQAVYDEVDEKTAEGKRWIEKLQEAQKALQDGYEAVIQFKHQNDVMHTTIVKFNKQIPGLIDRIEKLEKHQGRPDSRQRERERNAHRTGFFEGTLARGNNR